MKAPRMAVALCSLVFIGAGGIGCTDDTTTDNDGDGTTGEGEGEDIVASIFSTTLSGAAERPMPVATTMRGDAEFTIDGDTLDFSLNVEGGNDITAAHIHLGGAEEAGPVIVTLFGPADPAVDRDGELSSGSIISDDLSGPMAGSSVAALVEEMRSGATYVNVHTTQFPDGAVRGQIVSGPLDDGGIEPAGG